MPDYDVDGKVTTLTALERRLYHFALYKWCAVHGRGKHEWPGWAMFHYASIEHVQKCFLCRHQSAIACGGDYDECTISCLGGMSERYHQAKTALNDCPTLWIRKRAYYNACMDIAKTPFKEKTFYSARIIAEVKDSLRPLYLIDRSRHAFAGGILL